MRRDPTKLDAWRRRSKPLTTRSQLQRRRELRRGNQGLPRRNPERAARRFERAFGGEARLAWMHAHPCCVCGARPVHVHHVVTRGAGGTASDTVPLCVAHHDEVHRAGVRTFEARYGCNLRGLAREYEREWQRRAA